MNIKHLLQNNIVYKTYNKFRWRERKVQKGSENPNICFYVIRRHANRAGLFSFVSTNLASIKYALDHGYTPVIDMQNSPNPMLSTDEVGKVNAWDLFFEQPAGFTLDDINSSRSIVLSSIHPPENYPDYASLSDTAELNMWSGLMKKYIKLRPEIEADINSYIASTFKSNRVLGVLCRGTDYVALKPKDHPIQPDIDLIIEDSKKLIQERDLQLIYLATEDTDIWTRFNDEFPGKIISFQKHRFSTKDNENVNDIANSLLSPYERNREYLTSIAILSRCNVLLAGATSGSISALLMSNGYEYAHIYQLGTYQ